MLTRAINTVRNWLDLTDTPSSYSGKGNDRLKVNSGATALEFYDSPTVNIVADYGATGDGSTDDTTAFSNAISDMPTSGGTIVIPVTSSYYKITSLLTVDKPILFLGTGGVSVNPNSKVTRGARIGWGGGASAMFMVDGSGTFYEETGARFENLIIDGIDGTPTYGIDSDRWLWGGCRNVILMRHATAGMRLNTTSSTLHNNTMFCNFEHMQIFGQRCIELDASTTGGNANVCHCVFKHLYLDFEGDYALYSYDADDISIYHVYSFRRSGSGKCVYLGQRTRGVTFYNIQPAGGFENDASDFPSAINKVFGYDRGNGTPAPTITSGILEWYEVANGAEGDRSSVYNYTTGTLPAASTMRAGTTVYVSDASSGSKVRMSDGSSWINLDGGGGGAFTDLSDVPSSYLGYGDYQVRVKADETGLEFRNDRVIDGGTFGDTISTFDRDLDEGTW